MEWRTFELDFQRKLNHLVVLCCSRNWPRGQFVLSGTHPYYWGKKGLTAQLSHLVLLVWSLAVARWPSSCLVRLARKSLAEGGCLAVFLATVRFVQLSPEDFVTALAHRLEPSEKSRAYPRVGTDHILSLRLARRA